MLDQHHTTLFIHVQYLCTIFNGQTKCPMDIFLSIGPIAYWNIKWALEGVHWVFWIHWIQWSTAMSNGHLNAALSWALVTGDYDTA